MDRARVRSRLQHLSGRLAAADSKRQAAGKDRIVFVCVCGGEDDG